MPSWRAERKHYVGTVNVIHSEMQTSYFLFKPLGWNKKLYASEYPKSWFLRKASLIYFVYVQYFTSVFTGLFQVYTDPYIRTRNTVKMSRSYSIPHTHVLVFMWVFNFWQVTEIFTIKGTLLFKKCVVTWVMLRCHNQISGPSHRDIIVTENV
jgi:hypothetical protein